MEREIRAGRVCKIVIMSRKFLPKGATKYEILMIQISMASKGFEKGHRGIKMRL